MRTLIIVAVLILPAQAFSSCYMVGSFKGYSAKDRDNFHFGEDGISSKVIRLEFAGAESSVSGEDDMTCTQPASRLLFCTYSAPGRATVEAWSVDPEKGAVLYTKHMSGFSLGVDGVSSFKGRILGGCKS